MKIDCKIKVLAKRAKRGKKTCKKWQDATLDIRQPTQIGGENRARGMLAV